MTNPVKDFSIKDIIIFENDNILVLNKPAGLIVNKSHTTSDITLQDYLNDYLELPKDSREEKHDDFLSRSGIVHRLDKATSGVLVVAKNENTFISIQKQFKDRLVKKEYLAGIHGVLPQPVIEVDAPIERDKKRRTKFAVSRTGKVAKTRFELMNTITIEGQEYSLVRGFPETGRTHQLRVHLCALNVPIIGDAVYSGAKRYQNIMSTGVFHRMLLHSHRLGLFVPDNFKELQFFTAPIPSDFAVFYETSSKNMK